jgi:hypothetical protein
MNKKKDIDREVQQTLHCFDQLAKLPANPYLLTRLQAQLNNRRKEHTLQAGIFTSRLWRPVWIGIIIILNLGTAVLVYWNNNNGSESRTETLTVLSDEYGLHQEDTDLLASNE